MAIYLGRRPLYRLCAGLQGCEDDRGGKTVRGDDGRKGRSVQSRISNDHRSSRARGADPDQAQATGADNKIGSRMKLDLDVHLREDGDKTILGFVAGVDILGKLAALGHGIIKRKAEQVLDEFAQAVKTKLEGDG